MSVTFAATVDGLSATVDALTPIVAAVTAYFSAPARAIAVPVPVYPGEWEEWKATSDGPPGRVIISQTDFVDYDPGQWPGESGMRYAPGSTIDLDATHSVDVVGVRAQNFRVIVQGLANAGASFPADNPGAALALAQQVAAYALADLTFSALRDAHGHPIGPIKWAPMGADRGEFGYGSVLVGGFGPIPVPILGDVVTYVTPTGASATVLSPPATTGDTVTVP